MPRLFCKRNFLNVRFDCLTISFAFILFQSACSVSKPSGYFNELIRDTTLHGVSFTGGKFEISQGDLLDISVSSLNSELDAKFNAGAKSFISSGDAAITSEGYLVDNTGDITIHFLGKINVLGLTSSALETKLQEDLSVYLKEPIVRVKILNRKITVTGEVETPKVIYMNGEELSLLDALAYCGGVTPDADINDIIIIRDSISLKSIKHVNLKDHSIFNSPWYYLNCNDMIYVKRDNARLDKSEARRNLQMTMSLIVSVVSLTVTIANYLFK